MSWVPTAVPPEEGYGSALMAKSPADFLDSVYVYSLWVMLGVGLLLAVLTACWCGLYSFCVFGVRECCCPECCLRARDYCCDVRRERTTISSCGRKSLRAGCCGVFLLSVGLIACVALLTQSVRAGMLMAQDGLDGASDSLLRIAAEFRSFPTDLQQLDLSPGVATGYDLLAVEVEGQADGIVETSDFFQAMEEVRKQTVRVALMATGLALFCLLSGYCCRFFSCSFCFALTGFMGLTATWLGIALSIPMGAVVLDGCAYAIQWDASSPTYLGFYGRAEAIDCPSESAQVHAVQLYNATLVLAFSELSEALVDIGLPPASFPPHVTTSGGDAVRLWKTQTEMAMESLEQDVAIHCGASSTAECISEQVDTLNGLHKDMQTIAMLGNEVINLVECRYIVDLFSFYQTALCPSYAYSTQSLGFYLCGLAGATLAMLIIGNYVFKIFTAKEITFDDKERSANGRRRVQPMQRKNSDSHSRPEGMAGPDWPEAPSCRNPSQLEHSGRFHTAAASRSDRFTPSAPLETSHSDRFSPSTQWETGEPNLMETDVNNDNNHVLIPLQELRKEHVAEMQNDTSDNFSNHDRSHVASPVTDGFSPRTRAIWSASLPDLPALGGSRGSQPDFTRPGGARGNLTGEPDFTQAGGTSNRQVVWEGSSSNVHIVNNGNNGKNPAVTPSPEGSSSSSSSSTKTIHSPVMAQSTATLYQGEHIHLTDHGAGPTDEGEESLQPGLALVPITPERPEGVRTLTEMEMEGEKAETEIREKGMDEQIAHDFVI